MYNFDDMYQHLCFTNISCYSFNDGPVYLQIWALLTSQCRVSDNQVTIKAHWPLVDAEYCQRIYLRSEAGFSRGDFVKCSDNRLID